MTDLKTKATKASVNMFLRGIEEEKKRKDSLAIQDLMGQVTKTKPEMWGTSIVGFGRYRYKYASGRQGEWFLTGFSPRKQNLTLYVMSGFEEYDDLLKKLGKYTAGKSCLYIKSLDEVHIPTLKKLIQKSVKHMVKSNA